LNKQLKYIILSLILALPVLLVYLPHFMAGGGDSGKIPTGFLMYDAPYYMANARELTDDGGFHLMYSNPFSHDYQSERIYFQPHTLLLGIILNVTGMDPGLLLFLFGLLCSVLFFRVIIELLQHLHFLEKNRDYLILLLFCWGGGIFSMTGLSYNIIQGESLSTAFSNASLFEPSGGWWFLNLGRNLVLPTEAFYHLVFFFCILMALKKNFIVMLTAALLMSGSHPFTGIELLLILTGWVFMEIVIPGAKYKPLLWTLPALLFILAAHCWYYLVYLNNNPEHHMLFTQWKLPWTLSGISISLAYGLVFLFVGYHLIRMNFFSAFRDQPPVRLFVIWFATAFLLSNHDLFMNPLQPLHFTRGYIWSSLFLLGIPVIRQLFDLLLKQSGSSIMRKTALILILFIFLSDNLFWLSNTALQSARNPDLFMTRAEAALYTELNKAEYKGRLCVSTDIQAGYRITVYTPLRSWYSHAFNTPDHERCLNQISTMAVSGIVPEEMLTQNPLLIFPANNIPPKINSDFKTRWSNGTYCILGY